MIWYPTRFARGLVASTILCVVGCENPVVIGRNAPHGPEQDAGGKEPPGGDSSNLRDAGSDVATATDARREESDARVVGDAHVVPDASGVLDARPVAIDAPADAGRTSDAGVVRDAGGSGADAPVALPLEPLGGRLRCAAVAYPTMFSGGAPDAEASPPGTASATGAVLSTDGTLWVAGTFVGAVMFGVGEPNQTVLVSNNGSHDLFLARYDAACRLLSIERHGGTADETVTGLAIAPNGVVVAGIFQGHALFGAGSAGTALDSAGGNDAFVARFANDGSLVWAKSAGGPGSDSAHAVDALVGGGCVVTGTIGVTAVFGAGEAHETALGSVGAQAKSLFVARFLDDGSLAWARQTGGAATGTASPQAIATAPDESAFVVGSFRDQVTFGPGEPAETTVVSTRQGSDIPPTPGPYTTDAFVAHYLGDGALDWVKIVNGAGVDLFTGVALDPSSSELFTSGQFGDPNAFPTDTAFGPGEPGGVTIQSRSDSEAFAAHYSATNGRFESIARVLGPESEEVGGPLALHPAGGVVTAGQFGGLNDPLFPQPVTFGKGEANQTDLFSRDYAMFLARYQANGQLAWVRPLTGSSNYGTIHALTVTPSGTTLAVGQFAGSLTIGAGYTDEMTIENPDVVGLSMFVAAFGP